MKTLIQKTFATLVMVGVLYSGTGQVFAEISWTDEDPGMYRYNYNTYTNPNIDYVSSTCIGCENINQTSNISLIDENPSTYQYNYNTYTNPNIDYITSDCVGCGYTTSGYTEPTYTYPTYTEPTYTYPTYTTPSYTTSGYSSGSYVDYNTYSSPSWTGYTGSTYYSAPTYYTSSSYGTYSTGGGTVAQTNKVCANGQVVPVNSTCYRTCPNGSVVPETQSCPTVVTPGVCPQDAQICPDGSSVGRTGPNCSFAACPATPAPCPAGYTRLANGTCQAPTPSTCTYSFNDPYVSRYNHDYPSCTKVCSNGTTVTANTYCPAPVTPVQNQTCWDGSVIPVTQVCPLQYKTCSNGTTVPVAQTCYKVCPNGTTVPESSTCYRTCPNGSVIPEYQSCPVVASIPWVDINANPTTLVYGGNTTLTWTSQNATNCSASNGWSGYKNLSGNELRYNITQPTTFTITCYNSVGNQATDSVTVYPQSQNIKFNNVVTSPVTEITKNSARCNGIGLIASGAQSTAWFEYGETSNLGRQTASASIGNKATAPFSNMLTNLKENTSYYCRAVMNNQYGTVKGEIVKFTTKSSKVTYVQPVAPTKVTGKTSTKTTVKNEIVCSDGSVVTVGSRGAATLINEGQKLISLHVEKVSGSLSPNSEATYRLVYKNLSDTRIAPLTFKVSVPSDMSFVNSTAGMFDANARTLTVSGVGLDPYAEGSLTWNVQVNNGALVGTSVVTTAYVIYTVPGTSGNETVQDEVTSYVVGTITEQTDSKSEGGKKVIGKSGDGIGFLPNTLIEWLALIAILFIIGILGRSLYVAYKGDNNNNHH
jgi:hypothetical protein